jgi:hypothetical protein
MPQYLISVWHDDTFEVDFSTPDAQRLAAQVDAFNNDLQQAGAWVFAAGLHPASSATVVRLGRRGIDDRRALRRNQRTDGRLLDHRSRRS